VGSRTWIKLYCDKWLEGSIRNETRELRGDFSDLLALAGSGRYGDTGEIKLADGVGFTDQQLAKILKIPLKGWIKTKKRLQETERIEVDSITNIIKISNFGKYQSEYERQKSHRESAIKSAEQSAVESANEIEIEKENTNKETNTGVLEKKEGSSQLPDEMKELVSEFLKLPGWGNSQLANDVEWLSEFLAEFPNLSVSHIRGCKDFHMSRPKTKHTKGAWKSRLRNWMTNEIKWRADAKTGSKGRELPKNYTPEPEYLD